MVPHGDCSEAHILHGWIGLKPVYAQSGKLYSFTPAFNPVNVHFQFSSLCSIIHGTFTGK